MLTRRPQGLSPEEVTACLKRVEQQHGLSALLAPASAAAAAASASPASALATKRASSWGATALQALRRYGLAALVTALLAAGYARFRQKALEQAALRHLVEQAQRRARRASKVEGMLALLGDQQAQYAQAAQLLRTRVAKLQAAQSAAALPSPETQSAVALERKSELEALKKELLELRGAVVEAVVQPSSEAALEPATLPTAADKGEAGKSVSESDGVKTSGIKLSLTPQPEPITQSFVSTSELSTGDSESSKSLASAARAGGSVLSR